ncbi:tripartite tricarboxylate transporter TctB family protein [Oceanispirochaeta crateris]|uniref:Tripartite tricarboxylate transporter TctB family protein n=1 Tax=Oceanispirochaeta crateris TaxID=2518645 RepID=A0A5C1QPR3_9SPIO|nr:tripartite tricarboxylate transporter TctB family protein [Oceanispirochaeta crateris]QEN09641.1 tripartite tricarboxylate transporter TctB family protein [Oceanispirochaeta crateris]
MNSKKPYLNANVLTPVGIIVILIGYIAEALRMSSVIKMGLPSESFFPFMIFLLGFPIAVFLLIQGIIDTKKKIAAEPCTVQETEDSVSESAEKGRMINPAHKPFLITLLTFIFIMLFKYLGYTLTAPLYLFFFQMIYDDKMEHIPRKIITSLAVTVFVYILYVGFFNILFPEVWK